MQNTRVCNHPSSEVVSPLYAMLRFLRFPDGVLKSDLSTKYALSPIVSIGCVPKAGAQRL